MKNKFALTQYEIHSGLPEPLTIALVTDLHEHNPEPVLWRLRQAQPDLILVAGDTFERRSKERQNDCMEKPGRAPPGVNAPCNSTRYLRQEHAHEASRRPTTPSLRGRTPDTDIRHYYTTYLRRAALVKKLVRGLAYKFDDLFDAFANKKDVSPENAYRFLKASATMCGSDDRTAARIFLSPGNHDIYFNDRDYKIMASAGVTLLDNAGCSVVIRGQKLRIGGLSSKVDLDWLAAFAAKDGYKLLLCHHPEYYFKYIKGRYDFDLILSGHVHGGQWRIGGQGIYSPGQGLFPKYTRGVYEDRLVISAGCANTASVPRFGNPCELVTVKLT